MAPRTNVINKVKNIPVDNKKKEACPSVQKKDLVVYIKVLLPDETHVYLEGLPDYKINTDVRQLLSVNIITCNITNFFLSLDQVRGQRLEDTVDVSALKPRTLALEEVPYDKGSAEAHVTRLAGIVGCKTSLGLSVASAGEGDMNDTSPNLGSFCEFFCLSRQPPPLKFIREKKKKTKVGARAGDNLFSLEVTWRDETSAVIEASKKGFYQLEKQQNPCHNLVDLLRKLSTDFAKAYDELMKEYLKRNKFGDPPFGFTPNAWLIPPVVTYPHLPTEVENRGGDGFDKLPYARELSRLASMPCETAEERQNRDGKAFLIHSLFVGVAFFRAIAAVKHVMETKKSAPSSSSQSPILYEEKVGDLITITVMKDASNAAAAHDISTPGVLNVRFGGYIACVKVQGIDNENGKPPLQMLLNSLMQERKKRS